MALYGAGVEYALHTLLNLAMAGEGSRPSARDLADFQKLPVPFVRKLLTQLERAGIVASTQGTTGGWRLQLPADRISVLDVAEAMHGDEPLFECREIRARCALWADDRPPGGAVTGTCSIHGVMLAAQAAMRRELSAHTLEDVSHRVAAKSSSGGTALADWFAARESDRAAARRSPRRQVTS